MKNRLTQFSALLALACMAVFGADVTGKWAGAAGAGKGAPQTFNLKQDGSALTGTVEGGRGGPLEISNGKVEGDKVSFEVVREFNGNSITLKYSGTVSGNAMQLTVETGRGPREVTLTRQ